jgi:hypothetical protein
VSGRLDPERLDRVLRDFLADVDYDLHKSWERDEEDGKDYYHLLVKSFIECWEDSK